MPFTNVSSPLAVVIHENITEREQVKQQLEYLAHELELRGMGPSGLTNQLASRCRGTWAQRSGAYVRDFVVGATRVLMRREGTEYAKLGYARAVHRRVPLRGQAGQNQRRAHQRTRTLRVPYPRAPAALPPCNTVTYAQWRSREDLSGCVGVKSGVNRVGGFPGPLRCPRVCPASRRLWERRRRDSNPRYPVRGITP